MQKVHIEIAGVPGVPLLTHNERLANPSDPIARRMKEITSKRKKTDDDHLDLARLEFEGGFYLTEDDRPGIPTWNVFRCIQEGGKRNRLGKSIERSVQMLGTDVVPISFDGPKTVQGMWDAGCYDQRSVKVGQSKVIRTRPSFRNWSVEVDLMLLTEVLGTDDFAMAVENAGIMEGLGDYRPRFGRFDVADMVML